MRENNNAMRPGETRRSIKEVKYPNWNRDLLSELEQRKDMLAKMIADKEASVSKAPEGSLRVLKKGGYNQYYVRTDPKDTNGAYIKKKREGLAYALAQKDYDERIIKQAMLEKEALEEYISLVAKCPIESIYDTLSDARRNLVNPIFMKDEEYRRIWMAEEYERMPFDDSLPFYSSAGVRLRSKSEVMIADMLERYDIPYKYEYPLKLEGLGTARPDFLCLNVKRRKEFVWEHFGMMDNISYANKNVQKLNVYEQNGFTMGDNLIATFESSQNPLGYGAIKSKIEMFLLG